MALVVWRTGAWQLVKRSDAAGFEVLPKRSIVERTFAWISRNRRLGSRLRTLRHNGYLIHPPRHDPHHAKTARRCKRFVMNPNFSDGLSEEFAVAFVHLVEHQRGMGIGASSAYFRAATQIASMTG